MTDCVSLILARSSEPALTTPAPQGKELEEILRCALRAPDHALLRPWRYLVIEGDGRKKLGEAWQEAILSEEPGTDEAILERARSLPLRAPMLIVGITSPRSHPKVPEIEQQISTGVGLGYLLLALESRGYGAMWRTGAMAYHPVIERALGLESHESVTGILYVGTPSHHKGAIPAPDPSEHIQYWS